MEHNTDLMVVFLGILQVNNYSTFMLQYASSNMDVDNKNSKYIFKLYTVYFNNLCLYYFSLCSDMLDIKRNVHKTQY